MAYNTATVAYDLANNNASWYDSFADDLENHGYVYAISQRWGTPTANQVSTLSAINSWRQVSDVAALRSTANGMRDPNFVSLDIETVSISDTTGSGNWSQGYWSISVDVKYSRVGLPVSVSLSFSHHTS